MTANGPQKATPVGVSDMEAEHKLLHELLNALHAALAGSLEDEVAELLRRFEDVAKLHFMEEQSLMRLHAYPGYADHQQEHDELVAELAELSTRVMGGDFADAAVAAKGLEDWLVTHMETTDAALEKYLEEEGIRAGVDG